MVRAILNVVNGEPTFDFIRILTTGAVSALSSEALSILAEGLHAVADDLVAAIGRGFPRDHVVRDAAIFFLESDRGCLWLTWLSSSCGF